MDSERLARGDDPHSSNTSPSDDFFDTASRLTHGGSTHSLPEPTSVGYLELTALRDSGIEPLFESDITPNSLGREAFLSGLAALGIPSKRKNIVPQQVRIADVINAESEPGIPLWSILGVCIPRRASKTTTLFAIALGRCLTIEDYQVAYTAQSGTKARDRFLKDLIPPLERAYPDEDNRPFKLNRSRGGEHILFDNGSRLAILPPQQESFRGDSYDFVIADESQEHSPELSEDLLGAILPTFDTRPGAQLVIAGTAGKHRSGLLWDALEQGRAETPTAGIIEYAAPPPTEVHEDGEPVEDTTADPEVWKRAHPGIGNLTPLSALERNRATLSPEQFDREYLGLWPEGSESSFIKAADWDACRLEGQDVVLPERFALAYFVGSEGLSSSVSVAWRDEQGLAHIGFLEHHAGSQWVAASALAIYRKYRVKNPGLEIIFDSGSGTSQKTKEQLDRANPRPRLDPQVWGEVSSAAASIVDEIKRHGVRHYGQPAMDEAARVVVKSASYKANRWGLRPRYEGDDITPLVAASMALRVWDEKPERKAQQMMFAD